MDDEESSAIKRKSQIRSLGSSFLGTYSEAPQYLRRNEFIIGGYRIGFNSPKKVMKSLFMVHNETVNIWTHLLGAIIFIFLIFEGIAYKMEQSHVLRKVINDDILTEHVPITDGTIPTWPIMAFLIGASICLSCSAVFHWINPINQKVFKSLLRLDLAGVGINMVFMPIPAFYYSLYCNWQVAKFYISINVILGITSFISNMFDWIHRKENVLLRFSILTLSTICSIFGVIHMLVSQLYFNNYGDTYSLVPSLYFYGPAVMCLVLGFIFFISRCPQRSHPGRYDICGHSHQIWHVLIFLGIAFSYLGSIVSYEMRSLHSSCPAPYEPFQ